MYKVGFKTLAYLGVETHWQRRVSFTVSEQGLAELVHWFVMGGGANAPPWCMWVKLIIQCCNPHHHHQRYQMKLQRRYSYKWMCGWRFASSQSKGRFTKYTTEHNIARDNVIELNDSESETSPNIMLKFCESNSSIIWNWQTLFVEWL